MLKKTVWAAALLALHAAGAVHAQDDESAKVNGFSSIADRFYVAPMASYTFSAGGRHADDGLGGTLAFGKQLTDTVNAELSVHYSSFDGKGGESSRSLVGYGLNLIVSPVKAVPNFYFAAGIDGGRSERDSGKESVTLIDAGVGYLVGPFNWLNGGSFRVEARERIEQPSPSALTNYFEPVLSAGLLIPIGANPNRELPAAEQTPVNVVDLAPADSDHDGVPDDADQCPDSPAGAVDASGCPTAAEAADAAPVEAPASEAAVERAAEVQSEVAAPPPPPKQTRKRNAPAPEAPPVEEEVSSEPSFESVPEPQAGPTPEPMPEPEAEAPSQPSFEAPASSSLPPGSDPFAAKPPPGVAPAPSRNAATSASGTNKGALPAASGSGDPFAEDLGKKQ